MPGLARRLCAGVAALAIASASVAAPSWAGPQHAGTREFPKPIGSEYEPRDKDERGLWMQMDELERGLRTSHFVIRDPALNDYVRGVFCRTVGAERCAPVRLYLIRSAEFNAAMAPNGIMLVYTGLLFRMQDEAQLAAVLGHEYVHYADRHSLQGFRDMKRKANAIAWLSLVPVGGYAAAAALTIAQIGLIGALFRFSREMEAEADAGSIPLMVTAGYDPGQAARIWGQLRDEQDATAVARKRKSRKDVNGGMFASHPPTDERMAALATLAKAQPRSATMVDGRAPYRAAMRPWWPALVDDQVKLNDFGGTEYLLGALSKDGWTTELLYARGELYRARGTPADLGAAAGFYRSATERTDAPAEAWRGLGLAELRGGRTAPGQAALREYLVRKPDANDKSMMTMMLGRQS